jgi:hypothetical protein
MAAGPISVNTHWAGGTVFTDQRPVLLNADPASVCAAIGRTCDSNGWYAGDNVWRIRGGMDAWVGGPGLRRGERHPDTGEFGEALDFGHVISLDDLALARNDGGGGAAESALGP